MSHVGKRLVPSVPGIATYQLPKITDLAGTFWLTLCSRMAYHTTVVALKLVRKRSTGRRHTFVLYSSTAGTEESRQKRGGMVRSLSLRREVGCFDQKTISLSFRNGLRGGEI